MREKLIELFEECDKKCHNTPCDECEYFDNRDCNRQMELDHLIANGVTVSPCKVGQTVYYLFQYSDKRILPFVRKAKVKRIYCGNPKMKFLVDCELMDTQEKGIIRTWHFDDFGKTVFLTKEEAEAHLPQPPKGE